MTLSLLIIVPVAGAVLVALLPREQQKLTRWVAFVV